MNIIDSGKLINKPRWNGIGCDIEKLEWYVLDILPIKNELDEIRKEKNKVQALTKTGEELQADLKKGFEDALVLKENSLTAFIQNWQIHQASSQDVVTVLRQVIEFKSVLKNLSLLNNKGVEGTSKKNRDEQIKTLDERKIILKTKLDNLHRKIDFRTEERYIERWTATVANYCNPTDGGGVWLSESDGIHKRLMILYLALELETVPRNKLFRPMIVEGKEWIYHPGHYYKGGLML